MADEQMGTSRGAAEGVLLHLMAASSRYGLAPTAETERQRDEALHSALALLPPEPATAPTLRAYREDGGWGRLRVEAVPPYVPTRAAVAAKLASLSKAWPVLAEHAQHMDGEFDNALSDLRRMVDALHTEVARLQAAERLSMTPATAGTGAGHNAALAACAP